MGILQSPLETSISRDVGLVLFKLLQKVRLPERRQVKFSVAISDAEIQRLANSKLKQAVKTGLDDLVRMMVEEYIFESPEGEKLIRYTKNLMERFPALNQEQRREIEEMIAKHVLGLFQQELEKDPRDIEEESGE